MAIRVLSNLCLVLEFLLFEMVVSDEESAKDFLRREHSLVKPYQGPGLLVSHWDFLGSTIVTNNYIRLTRNTRGQFGAIWNNVPCQAANWELHVHFKVYGSQQPLNGDGFAIWYTKERMQTGSAFGSAEGFTGLAVFFDTYNNNNGHKQHSYPYISVMANAGAARYDHNTDGEDTLLGGCNSSFRDKAFNTNAHQVSTDIEDKKTWRKCITLSGIELQTGYYFGVSAATGDLTDNHDIISTRMYDLDADRSKLHEPAPEEEKGVKEPESPLPEIAEETNSVDEANDLHILGNITGWKLLAATIFLVAGLGGCVMGGIFFHK